MTPALALLLWLASAGPPPEGEARVSLDVKDGEVTQVVRVLAEVGDFQVVFDPDVSCRFTLRVERVLWPVALEHALRACGLAQEGTRRVVRIAPSERLAQEARERRELAEAVEAGRERQVERYRLSYARAQELAPLVEKLLPGAEVVFDQRTNTLIIVD